MQYTKFDGPRAVDNLPLEMAQVIDDISSVGEEIRKAGSIATGILFERFQDTMDLRTFNNVLFALKRSKLVREVACMLHWTGPQPKKYGFV